MTNDKIIDEAIKHAFAGEPLNRLGIEVAIKKVLSEQEKKWKKWVDSVNEENNQLIEQISQLHAEKKEMLEKIKYCPHGYGGDDKPKPCGLKRRTEEG